MRDRLQDLPSCLTLRESCLGLTIFSEESAKEQGQTGEIHCPESSHRPVNPRTNLPCLDGRGRREVGVLDLLQDSRREPCRLAETAGVGRKATRRWSVRGGEWQSAT